MMTKHSPEAKAAADFVERELRDGFLNSNVVAPGSPAYRHLMILVEAARGVRLQATREQIAEAWDEGAKFAAEFVSDNSDVVADFAGSGNPVQVMGWLMSQFRAPNPYRSGVISEAPKQDAESGNPPAPIQGDERNTP